MLSAVAEAAMGAEWARHAAIHADTRAERELRYALYNDYVRDFQPRKAADTSCGGYGRTHTRAWCGITSFDA